MKDSNIDFLKLVYHNAKMGEEAIVNTLKNIKESPLKDALRRQRMQYREILKEAKDMLYQYGEAPEDLGFFTKMQLRSAIKFNTLVSNSESHVAEMMMQGSNMGIIDMTRELNEYDDVDPEVRNLGEKLLMIEEENFQNMRRFL
ncbi:MAG: hypothetical protein GX196_09515 [Clostridiaceae bacterium]|nr:hypothetical protein [Clostridiaceae bacterium]